MPWQEVRGPFGPTGSDDEVDGLRRTDRESVFDLFDRRVFGIEIAGRGLGGDRSCDTEQFRAAAVRDRDVQVEFVVVGGTPLGVFDRIPNALGKTVDFADGSDSNAPIVDLRTVRERS